MHVWDFEMRRFASNSTITVLFFTALLFGTSSSAIAGLSEWFTETAVSDDGKYLLVTISDRPLDVELADDRLSGEKKEQVEYVRTHYPKCGLYLNDGSNTPLWTYNGRWSGDPIIAPDGEHVIFPGAWMWNEYEFQAVEFTRRGQTIRSYDYFEIISAWWLKRLLNRWRIPTCEDAVFDPVTMTYTIRTNQQEEFVFDVRSGEIIDSWSPFPTYLLTISVVIAATIVAPLLWAWHKKAIIKTYSGAFGS